MEKQKILKLIKNRHKTLKLTQEDMAGRLGVESSQYGRYELGKNEMSLDKLLKIGGILGLKIDVDIEDETDSREEMKAELVQEFIDFLQQK